MGGGGSKKTELPLSDSIVPMGCSSSTSSDSNSSTTDSNSSTTVSTTNSNSVSNASNSNSTDTQRPIGTLIADKHSAPPKHLIKKLIQRNRVVPSEMGAYDFSDYHSNITGTHAGFNNAQEWLSYNKLKSTELLACGSWDNVDITAFDADWAVEHGSQVLGTSFDPIKLHRQRLKDAHTKMVNAYKNVVNTVKNNNVQAFARLIDQNGPYASKGSKCKHSGDNDVLQIYTSALNALVPLWELSNRIAEAAGGVGANKQVSSLAWSLKGFKRVRKKTFEKYNDDFRLVTDIARTSIVYKTLDGLMQGMDYVLSDSNTQVVVIKNRFIQDVDGYSDILMNVILNDHVCEIQFHLQDIYDAKKDGGHKSYKWFRLLNVIDTKGVSVTNADGSQTTLEYDYDGKKDDKGQPHGFGICRKKDGLIFQGNWVHGKPHGDGIQWESGGGGYQGSFINSQKEGEGIEWYASGNVYQGDFKNHKRSSPGGLFWMANGVSLLVTEFDARTDQPTGQAVMWSADKTTATTLMNSVPGREMPLEIAEKFAEHHGRKSPGDPPIQPPKPTLPSSWI